MAERVLELERPAEPEAPPALLTLFVTRLTDSPVAPMTCPF